MLVMAQPRALAHARQGFLGRHGRLERDQARHLMLAKLLCRHFGRRQFSASINIIASAGCRVNAA